MNQRFDERRTDMYTTINKASGRQLGSQHIALRT